MPFAGFVSTGGSQSIGHTGTRVHCVFEEGPGFTLGAVIEAAKGSSLNQELLPELAEDFERYAKGNIDTSSYPSSWDSSGRDATYRPLKDATIKDKARMGSPSPGKPNKRFGALRASIKGAVGHDSITITADATHAQARGRGIARLFKPPAYRLSMKSFPRMRGLVSLTLGTSGPMTTTTSPMGGRTAKFGPMRRYTMGDYGRQRKRLTSATSRSGSYAAAVNAQRPFLAFHKGLVKKKFYEHMDAAAGSAATGRPV